MSLELTLTLLALMIGILGFAGGYHRLVKGYIRYTYDPKVELTLQPVEAVRGKQFHITDEFNPTYYDEFEVEYHKLSDVDSGFKYHRRENELGDFYTYEFQIIHQNYGEKELHLQLKVVTDSRVRILSKRDLQFDPKPKGALQEFVFREGTSQPNPDESKMAMEGPYSIVAQFRETMNTVGTFGRWEIRAVIDVSVEVSEFEIPFIGMTPPGNFDRIELDPIERKWTILGPDNDDIEVELEDSNLTIDDV